MKDMFYNYDHQMAQRQLPKFPNCEKLEKLETNSNISIVKDAFGNDIGVRAYGNTKFNLYFYLNECPTDYRERLDQILLDGTILFEVLNLHHEIVYTTNLPAAQIINNKIIVELCSNANNTLRKGLYHIRVSAVNATNNLVIFYEDDGFLDII